MTVINYKHDKLPAKINHTEPKHQNLFIFLRLFAG